MSENKNQNENEYENVELIKGHPKTAIRKLAVPMILSMILLTANNVIDSFWVAGLGSDALAGLGFVNPIFFILLGLGAGLGTGASSIIARSIGEDNHDKANNGTIHSIIITIIFGIILTVFFYITLKDILIMMGASEVLEGAMGYGMPFVLGTLIFMFCELFGGIFRGEGDMKRANYPYFVMAIVDMILDPIFIYLMNWGLEGAAVSTVIAQLVAVLMFCYWSFIKKDTYVKIEWKYFKNQWEIYKDILLVGIPSGLEQLLISATSIVVNYLLVVFATVSAVAVYAAGWRLIQIAIMPAMGISLGALTVAGVAYGEKDYDKLNISLDYGVKLGLISSGAIGLLFFIFSPQLAMLFSYSTASAELLNPLSVFIKIMIFFVLAYPIGFTASCVLQGMGKGTLALLLTTNRNLILDVVFAVIIASLFIGGEYGVYWGISVGEIVGSILAYLVVKHIIKKYHEEWAAVNV